MMTIKGVLYAVTISICIVCICIYFDFDRRFQLRVIPQKQRELRSNLSRTFKNASENCSNLTTCMTGKKAFFNSTVLTTLPVKNRAVSNKSTVLVSAVDINNVSNKSLEVNHKVSNKSLEENHNVSNKSHGEKHKVSNKSLVETHKVSNKSLEENYKESNKSICICHKVSNESLSEKLIVSNKSPVENHNVSMKSPVTNKSAVAKSSKLQLNKQHERPHFVTLSAYLGGLGNCMFQAAAVIGVAAQHGYTPVIKNQTGLDLLKMFELPQPVGFKLENVQGFGERVCCEYNRKVKYIDHSKNLTLSGFLQSWKYFEGAEDRIRKAFTFKKEYFDKVKSFLLSVSGSEPGVVTVGIHVRRGDFLSDHFAKLGYTAPPVSYFRKAMKYFYDMFRNIRFVFASNDQKWCKDNFNETNMYFSPFTERALDMALVSACDHTIISGGTFSWWSGWLSKGKTIYYKGFPRNGSWVDSQFNKSGNYDDYYPRDWVGMY